MTLLAGPATVRLAAPEAAATPQTRRRTKARSLIYMGPLYSLANYKGGRDGEGRTKGDVWIRSGKSLPAMYKRLISEASSSLRHVARSPANPTASVRRGDRQATNGTAPRTYGSANSWRCAKNT